MASHSAQPEEARKLASMEGEEFRAASREMTDYIINYLTNIRDRRVLPEVSPGYLRPLLPPAAPETPDTWQEVMQDIERVIMPGVTHWHSPHFHAYFPTGNSYPALLASMLSDGIGCLGFTWIASPACTELEVVMMDWLGQLLGLPEHFLASSGGPGGGVIQGTASEATLVAMLTAKSRVLRAASTTTTTTTTTSINGFKDDYATTSINGFKDDSTTTTASSNGFKDDYTTTTASINGFKDDYATTSSNGFKDDSTTTTTSINGFKDDSTTTTTSINGFKGSIKSRLVTYCSDQAHSSVERACMLADVQVRKVESDDKFSMRGRALRQAVVRDKENGLVPFMVVGTMGTTSVCSFDNLREIGQVAEEFGMWLHVDAAYAGSALVCEEFRSIADGLELAHSFSFNPHKWLLVNFDCSAMWLKDARDVVDAFKVDPPYLRHEHQGKMPDYRHWQIHLSRSFRSLKLWFVMRLYGREGLQAHIRKQVSLAHHIEHLVKADHRFEIILPVTLGFLPFRLKGQSNEVNEALVKRINEEGKIHLVPAKIRDVYFLRFTVGSRLTEKADVEKSWLEVVRQAEAVLQCSSSLPLTPPTPLEGKKRPSVSGWPCDSVSRDSTGLSEREQVIAHTGH